MLKQNLFTACFCCILWMGAGFSILNAQNSLTNTKTIKGKTMNAITGESISFVNLGIQGTTIGTASDNNGEFTLLVPDTYLTKFDLFYSAIGFESGQLPLARLKTDSVNIFKLTPTQYKLNELDVSAKSKVAVGIIKDAVSKIQQNYPSYPFTSNFIFKAEKEYNLKSEAVSVQGEIYDSIGYAVKDFHTAYASRSYIFNEPEETELNEFGFNKGITSMDALLDFDIVGSMGNVLSVNHLDKYSLTLVGTTTYQEDQVYVIAYKNLSPSVTSTGDYYVTSYEGEIFISKSSKAVLKNTTQVKSSMHALYGRGLAIPDGMKPLGKDLIYDFSTTYNLKNGLYHLGTISLNINYLNNSNEKVNYEAQLIIEGFNKSSVMPVPIRDVLKSAK